MSDLTTDNNPASPNGSQTTEHSDVAPVDITAPRTDPDEAIGKAYADAGVDIAAGARAVELIKPKARKTFRPEVVGGLGGFAGLFSLDTEKYTKPLLASSTDGVGTKLLIAQKMDIHDTVGIDLVAMVVDDLVVCGAEPLFLLDYLATGSVVPEKIARIVGGIADGCRWAGCALVGGEIAEHPSVLAADEYDLSATGVGIVEADHVLNEQRVEQGDVLIALRSSGLHSNGYSLVRKILLEQAGMRLEQQVDDLGNQRSLGEELLAPTKIYAPDCLALINEVEVHAFSHITGGGIPGNVGRVLSDDIDAVIDRSSWTPQPIFDLVANVGGLPRADVETTLNMGIGMVAVVPPAATRRTLSVLAARRIDAWVVGEVTRGTGRVRMVGSYAQ